MFSQDAFEIDTSVGTACCPNGVRVQLRVLPDNSRTADFASHCVGCSLRGQCTTSKSGRVLRLHPKHETLTRARTAQRDPSWKQRYRATRPKVERKIAHLMRTRHGGRRARVRGRVRIGHDFAMLAAAVNLYRLAALRAPIHAPQHV
jgi:Transposase DDE domain